MPTATIDQLIINSPYEEPREHWKRDPESKLFSRVPGRRSAGYIRATESSKAVDDPGIFIELPRVNKIRPRVKAWREAGYPGVTGISKRLLEYWRDPEQRDYHRLFFCQVEAIETLIWLTEAPASERVGIDIPSDRGDFLRLCSKMATGSGKTIVMAMLIAWQVLDKVTYPKTSASRETSSSSLPDSRSRAASKSSFPAKTITTRNSTSFLPASKTNFAKAK